jgi:hypothetical protein
MENGVVVIVVVIVKNQDWDVFQKKIYRQPPPKVPS